MTLYPCDRVENRKSRDWGQNPYVLVKVSPGSIGISPPVPTRPGALHGGSPMSHIEFKKCQCPYFCNIHVDFKIV